MSRKRNRLSSRGRIALSAAAALSLCGAVFAAGAQGAISGSTNANVIASAISSSPPVTGAALDTAPGQPAGGVPPKFANGTDNTPLTSFPTNGSDFAILTSGDVNLADDPNSAPNTGYAWNFQVAARGVGAFDPSTLRIPISVPSDKNCLGFDYQFLSDEFPEFVGSSFNDVFVAELDTTSWTVDETGNVSEPNDFAARGTQVSVNGIGPNAVTPENANGTTYDAASALLATKTPVAPGSSHTLFLSITDSSDAIYDSAVFVDNLHFTSEPATSCHPPDIFQGQVGTSVGATTFKVKGGTVSMPLTCALPPQATINCENDVVLQAPSGQLARASKTVKISNSAHASIPPSATVAVKLKLTKKAKKHLKKKGKIKAKAVVTNTYNGAQTTSKAVLKQKRKRHR